MSKTGHLYSEAASRFANGKTAIAVSKPQFLQFLGGFVFSSSSFSSFCLPRGPKNALEKYIAQPFILTQLSQLVAWLGFDGSKTKSVQFMAFLPFLTGEARKFFGVFSPVFAENGSDDVR